MSKQKSLAVVVNHDIQIGVWYVVSADIPGLHVETETLDELVSVVADLAPKLISATPIPVTPANAGVQLSSIFSDS